MRSQLLIGARAPVEREDHLVAAAIAAILLGATTLGLLWHLIRWAALDRLEPSQHPLVPLIDLSRVGLGFAVCLVCVAGGRQVGVILLASALTSFLVGLTAPSW